MDFKSIVIDNEKIAVIIDKELNSIFIGSTEPIFTEFEIDDSDEIMDILEDIDISSNYSIDGSSHLHIYPKQQLNCFEVCALDIFEFFEEIDEEIEYNKVLIRKIVNMLEEIDNKNLRRDLYSYFDEV